MYDVTEGEAVTLAPNTDPTVHLVLDDLGPLGRVYREANESWSDLETVILDMLAGHFARPLRVVAFDTSAGSSRDCSEDVAQQVFERAKTQHRQLPSSTREFVFNHLKQMPPDEIATQLAPDHEGPDA
jgi:hypothetical protein